MSGKKPAGAHGGHGGRRAKKHEEEEHENHERWLVSYADMVTLLMCLFIVLYALSQVDVTKFSAFSQGLQQGFGAPVTILNDGAALETDTTDPLQPVQVQSQAAIDGTAQTDAEAKAAAEVAKQEAQQTAAEAQAAYDRLAAARDALAAALAQAGYPDAATFKIDERGLVVHVVADEVLFDAEEADLRPEGGRVLDALGPTLATLEEQLRVEGHANSLPVTRGGPWRSNWDLSAVRATTVLLHLTDSDGVPEGRMSATGYSDTRPLVPDSDPNALSVNRRVDIVVLSTASAEANALLPGIDATSEGSQP
ncbi:chemotaxis protein MotB [Modestobacter sp. DSM 44400]|uniref:OmpA/MotB family protein n=1 Tax=Modestobacter sp. DSM 44400 TaxID=1550230 RepID=UPI0008972F5E|nr:flagellar motor protein MotB [Modestobacter sp. DSM 44400]SDX87605.1 chemotaxis protein MotB [Modestobacter sp. DSM 44400]